MEELNKYKVHKKDCTSLNVFPNFYSCVIIGLIGYFDYLIASSSFSLYLAFTFRL